MIDMKLPLEGMRLNEFLKDLEVHLIEQALDRADGNRSAAAKMLGVHRTTLVEKIRRFGINFRPHAQNRRVITAVDVKEVLRAIPVVKPANLEEYVLGRLGLL
jgi:hypothetical protein